MNKEGSTDLNIQIRKRHLMIILSNNKTQKQRLTQAQIQSRLQNETGFKVDQSTISRDIKELNLDNSFVKDIAIHNYSKLNEDSFKNYLLIQSEAIKNYNKKWTSDKRTVRVSEDGSSTETTKTEELAHPKAEFLRIFMDAESKIQDMLNGKMLETSVVLMGDRFRQVEKELEIANAKLEKAAT